MLRTNTLVSGGWKGERGEGGRGEGKGRWKMKERVGEWEKRLILKWSNARDSDLHTNKSGVIMPGDFINVSLNCCVVLTHESLRADVVCGQIDRSSISHDCCI